MTQSRTKSDREGRLFIIGGAEDPDEKQMSILPAFVEAAGGSSARILVCGTPSAEPAKKERTYARLFRSLGAAEVIDSGVKDRHDAEREEVAGLVDEATAVFITGGDQLRLTAMMAGTKFGDRIRDRRQTHRLLVGGTSAGAAAMSSTMITGGKESGTARRSDVDLAPGLGYCRDMCIDSHFAQRGRVSRVVTLFAQNPQVLGVGIDENTAIDVIPEQRFTVLGEGVVYVFDGRVSHSNAPECSIDDALGITDVRMHCLPAGYGFDLEKKRPLMPDGSVIEPA